MRCHGNSFKDIKNPFTGLHLPCICIIQMKFEANRVKIRGWFQSILKMTHFLLPVGGAITLTHNSHIHVIVLLQRTQSSYSEHTAEVSSRSVNVCWSYNTLPVSRFSPWFRFLATDKPFEISKIPSQTFILNVLTSRWPSFVEFGSKL